ncbi:sensor histidine kinase [Mucilaginibacter sp. McL0603]|uniref:sensor histidine kinase n=1 Tax=Mucilaginibacter sp. McL0603 TaxID=3415670 RepID=UPI003CF3B5DA
MRKLFTDVILLFTLCLNCFLCFKAGAQTMAFYKPSEYKTSWQRLLLQLSSAFNTAAKENQVDLDSSLIYCAHSLGLSRLPVIAEGIDAPELSGQLKWIDKRDPKSGLRLLSAATGKEHLELLVLLGAYYAFEPDEYHRHKDSVLYFLNKAIRESKTQHEQQLGRQARLLIGKMYVDGYDFQHGDPIFDQLAKDCQAAGDHITEAKVWFYRGLYTGFTPVTAPKRIAYLQQARQLYHQQNNTEGEISALTDISYLNLPIFQLDKAHKAALKALSLAQSIQYPFIHYNTDAVAMVTILAGKFGEPLRYAFETVRVAEAAHDSIGLGGFYNRIGLLYYTEDHRHEEAQKWLEKAVYRMMRRGNDNVLYLTLVNLVNSLIASDHPDKAWNIVLEVSKKMPPKTIVDKLFYNMAYVQCYSSRKSYDVAEKYLVMADSIERQLEKNGYSFRHAIVTEGYGNLYFLKGDYAKARIFYEQYLSDPLAAGGGMMSDLSILDNLISIDSVQRDYVSQLRHFRSYKKLSDSNYTISKLRQAEELQVKYATAEKESQITLLSQKAKLEQVNLNKARLIKNVTIGGIVLVMIIAGLLYRQSRLRKRTNKIIARQNERITHKNELITHKNELLQKLVAEKDWLLKEVNHRVKNNLHMVISLLESQAMYLENDALKALQSSKNRIFSMSLIHQKLYQSEDVKAIDMSVYLPELVNYLRDGFDAGKYIHFSLEVDPVQLSVAQAIPLALVLNEAITNSIKYAFPGNRMGEISIKMRKTCENIELIIMDNGVGMGKATKDINLNSLGLKLMRGLVDDISGQINFENNNGTIITITFMIDLLVEKLPILNSSEKYFSA